MDISGLVDTGGVLAYLVVGGLAFLESAAFLGFVVPGETALLLGGVVAGLGHANVIVMLGVAVAAAVAGDSAGYAIGSWLGPPMKRGRIGRLVGKQRWEKGEKFLDRRGAAAVALGRWVGLLRAVVPALAGAGGMPYRKFLLWNVIGGAAWATTMVLAGFAAGESWQRVEKWVGTISLVAAVVVGLAVIGIVVTRLARSPGVRRRIAEFAGRLGISVRVLVGAAAGVLGAAGLTVAWLVLADAVSDLGGAPTAVDTSVRSFVLAHRDPALTRPMIVLTNACGTLGMTVLAAAATVWLTWRGQRARALLVVVTGLGAAVLVTSTKALIGRVRPPAGEHLVLATNPAFPSGHALGAFVVVGVVTATLLPGRWQWVARTAVVVAAAVLVLAVGVSRVYLGVHWTTDVLGGFLLGAAWLTLCLAIGTVVTKRSSSPNEAHSHGDRAGPVRLNRAASE